MKKIIDIGEDKKSVRILHMKKSVIYFIENVMELEITPYQREHIKRLRSLHANQNNKDSS